MDVAAGFEVELPPGASVDEHGNVFDARGVLIGRLELDGGGQDAPPPEPLHKPGSAINAESSSPVSPQDVRVDMVEADFTGVEPEMGTLKPLSFDAGQAPVSMAVTSPKVVYPPTIVDHDAETSARADLNESPVEIAVVDGTPFGLPPGQFIGPDGTVFDSSGQPIGFLQGYAEAMGPQHPHPKQPIPVVLGDPNSAETVQEEAVVEGGHVYIQGQMVGKVEADGTVVAADGRTVATLPAECLQAITEAEQVQERLTEEEKIARLLYVPEYHTTGGTTTDGANNVSLDDSQHTAAETWAPLEVENSIPEMPDPPQGFEPLTFKADLYNKKRAALPKAKEFVPSRFTRPYMAPDYPPDMKIMEERFFVNCLDKRARVNFEGIKIVWVTNVHKLLSKAQFAKLGAYLSQMKNMEVLGIFSSELKKLELNLPKLLRLDLRFNKFGSAKEIAKACANSPLLQSLDVSRNPFCLGWKRMSLPPSSDALWTMILEHVHLELLNGEPIPNVARYHALEARKSKHLIQLLAKSQWHHALNRSPVIANQLRWEPLAIHDLALSEQGLIKFNVAPFANLVQLSLSKNYIETIEDAGLHMCNSLSYLDLSHNLLDQRCLVIIAFLPSLRQLFLAGNPKLEKLGSQYRHKIIFSTRFLKGSNRTTGLLELDGKIVTLEERVNSVTSQGSSRLEGFERWSLNLINTFGHYQLRTVDDLVARANQLPLVQRNLGWVDVSQFVGLQILDLSANRLRDVPGLENCRQLRVLNLSRNIDLSLDRILKRLAGEKPLTTLEQVFLCPNPAKMSQKHLRMVLTALGPHNTMLAVIDQRVPSIEDRIALYRATVKDDEEDAERYRTDLAIVIAATPFEKRKYAPADVKLAHNEQYKPEEVTDLLRMCNMGLMSKYLFLGDLVHLRKLNLSGNNLTEMTQIGLDRCPHLQSLDVRNNKINTSKAELGNFINGLSSLEVLAIRGNPCMRNRADRVSLLSAIPRLREVECTLLVVDTPITIDERVSAMKKAGISDEESEDLRVRVALYLRTPRPSDIVPREVRALNLDDLNLQRLDLSAYPNLEVLRLRNSRLPTLRGLGLESMPHLRVLDLRDNLLEDMKEVIEVVSNLKNLEFAGFLGNRFSDANRAKAYRERFVGSVRQLRRVGCPLVYLDEQPITADEIVEGWEASGGRKETCALFRFDLAVHRRLPAGAAPQNLLEFDLSHCKLTMVDLLPFEHIVRLNLAHNELTWRELKSGHISKLQQCQELSLAHNLFEENDLPKLGALVRKLEALVAFHLVGNPCLPDNSTKQRCLFLSHVPNVDAQGLRLQVLNGRPITIEERVNATALRDRDTATEAHIEAMRTVLTLEAIRADLNQESLSLANQHLKSVVALRSFKNLMHLDLSNNELRTLHKQGLDQLPRLQTLDLRNNRIATLKPLIMDLSKCAMLEHLFLHKATADGRTNNVNSPAYLKEVTYIMQGLITLDGQQLPPKLSAMQRDAQQFLYRLAGVGANTLRNVDIADMNIPGEHFFYVLAALKEIGCVETLNVNGNGWNTGAKMVPNLRKYCIHELGPAFVALDGNKVIDEERLLAFQHVREEVEKLNVNRLYEWKDCRHKAFLKLETQARLNQLPYNKKKDKEDYVDFYDLGAPIDVSSGGGDGNELLNKEHAVGGGVADESKASPDGSQDPNQPQVDAAKANDSEQHDSQSNDESVSDKIKKFGTSLAKRGEILLGINGTFITKMEILINFLQIYGLILILDVDIPWPKSFLKFSIFVRVFTIQIDAIWDMKIPYAQQLLFGVVMTVPAICIWFYTRLQYLNKDKWIASYVTDWKRTKKRVLWSYFGMMLLALIGGFAYDHPASWHRVSQEHTTPSPKSNGLIGVCWLTFTVFLLIWYLVVNTFRKHRLQDTSPNHEQFFEWWLQRVFNLRRVALFMLTIFFMPVARVILLQFQCYCPAKDGITPQSVGVWHPASSFEWLSTAHNAVELLAADSTPLDCYIKPFPRQRCLPHTFSPLQGVAVFFGLAYVIGIPAFFFVLIRRGVHQMVDIHGFKDEAARAQERIVELKKLAKKDPEARSMIKRIRKDLKNFYFNKATSNKVPQTYLYAPYQRSYRFFKLFNMFQKLMLIVVTMFFPAWAFAQFKLIAASTIVGLFALVDLFSRPFNDRFENLLEVASQCTNAVNVVSAVGLQAGFLSQRLATILLFGFNGFSVAMFALSVLASPILYCKNLWHLKRATSLAKEHAAQVVRTFSAEDQTAVAKAAEAVAQKAKDVGAAAVKAAPGAGAALSEGADAAVKAGGLSGAAFVGSAVAETAVQHDRSSEENEDKKK